MKCRKPCFFADSGSHDIEIGSLLTATPFLALRILIPFGSRFSISKSEDKWAFLAGAENRLRLFHTCQDNGVGPLKSVDGFPEGLLETEPVAKIFLNHVRHDFGVRS